MIETDDDYRIVEDEFLNVAQKFTAHLHRAEYQRQKALAASRNAETIRAIQRPVVEPHTQTTRQRAEVARKKALQRKVADSNNDPPELSTGLRGLMESPRKEARSIQLGKTSTATRAAAGFGSQSSPNRPREGSSLSHRRSEHGKASVRERAGSPARRKRSQAPARRRSPTVESDFEIDTPEEDSEDDFGTTAISQKRYSQARANMVQKDTRKARETVTSSRKISKAKSAPDLKQRTRPGPSTGTTETVPVKDGGNDSDDPFGVKRMRLRRARSRDQVRRPDPKESVDLIPSFL